MRKTSALFISALFIFSSFSVLSVGVNGDDGASQPVYEPLAWYLTFQYRKKVDIVYPRADLQMQMKIGYSSGVGVDTQLNGCCRTNFGDIRFTTLSNVPLPYWLETYTSGVNASFWIKTNGASSIYLYYGNATATTTSNGTNTFILFDDSSKNTTSQWTTTIVAPTVYWSRPLGQNISNDIRVRTSQRLVTFSTGFWGTGQYQGISPAHGPWANGYIFHRTNANTDTPYTTAYDINDNTTGSSATGNYVSAGHTYTFDWTYLSRLNAKLSLRQDGVQTWSPTLTTGVPLASTNFTRFQVSGNYVTYGGDAYECKWYAGSPNYTRIYTQGGGGGTHRVVDWHLFWLTVGKNPFTYYAFTPEINEKITGGGLDQVTTSGSNKQTAEIFKVEKNCTLIGWSGRGYRTGGLAQYTVTLEVRTTTGNPAVPTATVVGSNTFDVRTFPTGAPAAWGNVTFTTPIDVTAGVNYALVCRYASTNIFYLNYSSENYSDGHRCYTTDGGTTWTPYTSTDMSFRLRARMVNETKWGTFYTAEGIDITPPVISSVLATPIRTTPGNRINITANITDNVAVNIINLTITGPVGFTPVSTTMNRIDLTNKYYYNVTYTIIGAYQFKIWANDTNDNAAQTSYYPFYIYENPTVITNDATGVQATNATLLGALTYDGGQSCTVRFQYGLTTSYGTNTTNQYKTTGQAFSVNVGSLTRGKLYHFRAYANNTIGFGLGSDKMFLTKPAAPTGLSISFTETGFSLLWTHGSGYNRSVVRGQIGSYPSTPQSGTEIYNGTSNSCTHDSLSPGDTWYYSVWEYSTWGALSQFSSTPAQANKQYLNVPTVTTNSETGVQGTNATLRGTLTLDGGETCNVRFQYGTTTSYGMNTTNQSKTIGQSFNFNVSGLLKGQLYHFRAFANNTMGVAHGSDKTFVTIPDAPITIFMEVFNTTRIDLSWTRGNGTNYTRIERNATGQTVWARGTGILIYNNTGTNLSETGLHMNVTYHYQAWGYSKWGALHQWSVTNTSQSATTYYRLPDMPANVEATVDYYDIHLSWDKQDDLTVIRRSDVSYPTSLSDGVLVYSGDASGFVDYNLHALTVYYYSLWSYNTTREEYSPTYATASGETIAECYQCGEHKWFNSLWINAKEIIVKNATNGQVVFIKVYNADVYDQPFNRSIDTNGNAKSNFGDVRFVDKYGNELLYNRTAYYVGNHSEYKIKLPSDIESDPRIYLYYNNLGASYTSTFNSGGYPVAGAYSAYGCEESKGLHQQLDIMSPFPPNGATVGFGGGDVYGPLFVPQDINPITYVTLGITVNNWLDRAMLVYWSTNLSGDWTVIGVNETAYNGRYTMSSYGIVETPHNVTLVYHYSNYTGGKYTYNPCKGADLGTIKYVRILTNNSFIPSFNGRNGSTYSASSGTTDITSDFLAPTEWSWSDIRDMDIWLASGPVDVAVTYDLRYGENTPFYWRVNATEGELYEGETYYFMTEYVSPTIENPSVPDVSTWLYLRPTLSVDVAEPQGEPVDVTFYTTTQPGNLSSGWVAMGSYHGNNGTYSHVASTFSNYSQLYYWRVNATDGTYETSKTYRFWTRAIQVPPIGLTATTLNATAIRLDWDKDNSTDYVMIKRAIGKYPLFSDPGAVYYGPDLTFTDTLCSPGTLYIYLGWSYNASDDTWTLLNSSADAFSKPMSPISLDANATAYNRVNLTWVVGDGAQKTVICRRKDNYPVSYTDTPIYLINASSLSDSYRIGGNITYYYRAWSYATIGFKRRDNVTINYTYYSDSYSSDSDKTPVGPPTIEALAPIGVTETNMTLRADVISDGGDASACGFYWGLADSHEHNVTLGVFTTDQSYSYPISGLTVGTFYKVTPWGKNKYGFMEQTERQFCTLPEKPKNFIALVLGADEIQLSWLKGAGADKTRVQYKTTGYPTSPTDGTQAYFDTGSLKDLTGLGGNVTYYFRAWSYNQSDVFYSINYSQASGLTFVGLPTIINYYPIYINDTEATLKGKLTYNNGDNCTVGYRYGTSSGVYTHNVSESGLFTTGQTFQETVVDLTIGTTWYYQSWAKNIAGFSNSTEIIFVTRPVSPSGFVLSNWGARQFNMSWVKGTGADLTRILRKTSAYPSNFNDGDLRYNSTGASFIDKDWYPPLDDTTYYYRAWSYNATNHLYSNLFDSQTDTTDPLISISNEVPLNGESNVNRFVNFSIKVDGGTDPINVTFWNTQEFDIAHRFLGDHASGWGHAEHDYSAPPINGSKGGVLDYAGGLGTTHYYWYNGSRHYYYQVHTAETWCSGKDYVATSKLTVTLEHPTDISGIQFSGGVSFWLSNYDGNGTGYTVKSTNFEYHDYNKNIWITVPSVPYGTDRMFTTEVVKVDQIRLWFSQQFYKDEPYYTAWRQYTGRGTCNWIAFVPPTKIYNQVVSPGSAVSFQSNMTNLNYTYRWGVTADTLIDRTYSNVFNFTTEKIVFTDVTPVNGHQFNDTNYSHDCSVQVNHTGGDIMTVSFYTRAMNGTYVLRQTYPSVSNGTYSFSYANSSSYNKSFYWKVVGADSLNQASQIYYFRIRDIYQPTVAGIHAETVSTTEIRIYNITRDTRADTMLIRYSLVGYPSTPTNGTFLMNSTDSLFNHSGLQPWTQYNYSAWGWNATDGAYSQRYTFYGRTEGGQTITDEQPVDNATDIKLLPTLQAKITDFDGDNMTIWFRSNGTGSWQTVYNWVDVSGGYKQTTATFAVIQSIRYWWSVNVTDGLYWNNQTFTFVTGSITPPQNFTAIAFNSTQINLSWTIDGDADDVQIMRRTDRYPIDRTDGTLVYYGNGTSAIDTGFSPAQMGYYSGFGYNETIPAWGYRSSQRKDLTLPETPQNFKATTVSFRKINLSWTSGAGANKTVIVSQIDFYPINSTDGSIIYNSSGTNVQHIGLKPGDYLTYMERLSPGINNMGVYLMGGDPYNKSSDGNESTKWDPNAGQNNHTFSYITEPQRWYSSHLLISDFYRDPGASWNGGISKLEVYNGTWHTVWNSDFYSPSKTWFDYNISSPWDIYSNVTQIRYTAWTQFISPNVYEVKIGKLGVRYKYAAYSFTELDGVRKLSVPAYVFNMTKDTPLNTPPQFNGGGPSGIAVDPHPTLFINMSDKQGQALSLNWESNYTGVWASLGTNVSIHNGTVRMPTTIGFNVSVYWRVVANDGADVSDSVFYKETDTNTSPVHYFRTRKAYVDANFGYSPAHPTNADIVTFTDLSKNATTIKWKQNNQLLTTGVFSSGTHVPFDYQKKFNISNIYAMQSEVENHTDAGTIKTITKNITVDRNLTYLRTPESSINYVGYHLPQTITSIALASTFHVPTGWWIHHYNSTSEDWESYWVNEITNSFNIRPWDTVVIVGYDQRTVTIPITQYINPHQSKTIPAGLSYLVWTSDTSTTLMNISIGLAAGDWIHVYDTATNQWNSRWVGYTLVGSNVQIKPYTVIAVSVAAPRAISIG